MSEIVINYHVTEKCNYICHHCFAKYDIHAKEIHHDLDKVEKVLRSTHEFFKKDPLNERIRLNFAGGEPLILKSFKNIIKIAKNIGFEELSLITNGSVLTKKFIDDNIKSFSMIGVSIDSFDVENNIKIGRSTNKKITLDVPDLIDKISYCRYLNKGIKIKINTVVNKVNHKELMGCEISKINPDKWKIFKVVPFNNIETITDKEFSIFIEEHKKYTSVPIYAEYSGDMEDSYIMIDPLGRFYQNSNKFDGYQYSQPIYKIGIENAFNQINFDKDKFKKRYIPINREEV